MSYTGTKLGQDIRFKNPDKDILLSMKTPKIFSTTVSKRNIIILPIIKLWLNKKIIELLEFEDETLVNLIVNLINSSEDKIDPKNMQYQISGFLGDKTYSFMKQFWKLLISVQECYLKDQNKIPDELIIFKIEYEKNKQKNKNFERYREYENDYNKNKKYENKNDYEDNTKFELMKVIDSYKKDEKYKIRNKSRSRSRSKSHHHHKRRYRSRSKEHYRDRRKEREEYKYKSNSRNKRRSRRKKSKSSSSISSGKERIYKKEREYYNDRDKDRKRKYSKDSSSSSSSSISGFDDYKQKRNRSDSSDSSETFKI